MKNLFLTILFILVFNLTSFSQDLSIPQSFNRFSMDLYKNVKDSNDNFIISPISLGFSLSMAYEGSAGTTQKQFEKLFHYSSNKQNTATISDLYNNLNVYTDSTNHLKMCNALWVQENFKIKPNYKQVITDNYNAMVSGIDFSNPQLAAKKVNGWVSENTNGLIDNILNPALINNRTRLILSNVIFFTGYWEEHFERHLTQKDEFHNLDKTTSQIDFMHIKKESFKYFKSWRYETVLIPYEDNEKVLMVILPKKINVLHKVENKLDSDDVISILENSEMEYMNLSIPKFKLESHYQLKENLVNMGLQEAFTDQAKFSGMAKLPLKISDVVHKTFFEVDEYKTVAAAATVIPIALTGAVSSSKKPLNFKADRPFIFMVIDQKLQSILFMGRYVYGK